VASCREFEAASGSEFDVPTASCNNLPSLSIDEIVQTEYDQEKEQELCNNFKRILQEQESNELKTLLDGPAHDFDSNQHSEILLCSDTTENSSLALVSELGWSQLAETATSPGTTQPGFFDNGELAHLVAAEDPSAALVSNLEWHDLIGEALVCNGQQPKNAIGITRPLPVEDNCEQLLKLVAAEDPSVALVSDHGWPGTAAENTITSSGDLPLTSQHGWFDTAVENTINSPRDHSLTNHQVDGNQTVTLTLPIVEGAKSLEQSRGQLLDDDTLFSVAVEANILLEANNSSPCNNNNQSSQEIEVDNTPDRSITNAGKTRPSVIVSTRKRALIPAPEVIHEVITVEDNQDDNLVTVEDNQGDEEQDDVTLAVLEKRRKGNARCKKYRDNKKQKEAIEETELEMLTRRNEFLRAEEKRLSERKRKLQQSYISLIRQKKIRFQ